MKSCSRASHDNHVLQVNSDELPRRRCIHSLSLKRDKVKWQGPLLKTFTLTRQGCVCPCCCGVFSSSSPIGSLLKNGKHCADRPEGRESTTAPPTQDRDTRRPSNSTDSKTVTAERMNGQRIIKGLRCCYPKLPKIVLPKRVSALTMSGSSGRCEHQRVQFKYDSGEQGENRHQHSSPFSHRNFRRKCANFFKNASVD